MRIAGVEVGKVVGVEHPEPGKERAVIRMRIEDEGRPVHADAHGQDPPAPVPRGQLADRPRARHRRARRRSPTAARSRSSRPAGPVQLGQVLTALQSDTRKNLQTLLAEYSSALEGEGADGFRRSIPYWKPAYRDSALVQEATLGQGEHDLSELHRRRAGAWRAGLDRSPRR